MVRPEIKNVSSNKDIMIINTTIEIIWDVIRRTSCFFIQVYHVVVDSGGYTKLIDNDMIKIKRRL